MQTCTKLYGCCTAGVGTDWDKTNYVVLHCCSSLFYCYLSYM